MMQFERLLGRRIVPHLLALFHLPVTCHAIFGCVVWSHGTCGIQTSLRVSADYIWPELRRFPVHPPAYSSS